MSWVFKQSREVSVTFFLLLATFFVWSGEGQDFWGDAGPWCLQCLLCSLRVANPRTTDKLSKILIFDKAVRTVKCEWRAEIAMIRELQTDLQTAFSSAGLVWKLSHFSRLGLANLILRSPNPSLGRAESLDTQLKVSSSLWEGRCKLRATSLVALQVSHSWMSPQLFFRAGALWRPHLADKLRKSIFRTPFSNRFLFFSLLNFLFIKYKQTFCQNLDSICKTECDRNCLLCSFYRLMFLFLVFLGGCFCLFVVVGLVYFLFIFPSLLK